MRQLYLLRHAKSSWDQPGGADFDRPLNKRGQKAAAVLNDYLLAQSIQPELVLCSPAARTRETCEALAPALKHSAIRHERTIYEAAPEQLLALLRRVPADVGSVMMIGHNPGLEQLSRLLLDPANPGETDALTLLREKFPTGALAEFDVTASWPALGERTSALRRFIRPIDLEAE